MVYVVNILRIAVDLDLNGFFLILCLMVSGRAPFLTLESFSFHNMFELDIFGYGVVGIVHVLRSASSCLVTLCIYYHSRSLPTSCLFWNSCFLFLSVGMFF